MAMVGLLGIIAGNEGSLPSFDACVALPLFNYSCFCYGFYVCTA